MSLTDLLEQICKAEQRVNENNSYVAYGQEKYNKIVNLIVHGLYALAEHYLGKETFETLDIPDDKSFSIKNMNYIAGNIYKQVKIC